MEAGAVSIALNLLALLAAGFYVISQFAARSASPVDRRLAALFAVLTILVGVRAVRWWLHAEALRRIEEMLAALLPLFALFVAEGLLRRHAPPWLKYAFCLGAAIFALAAALRPVEAAGAFAYALGGFVLLGLSTLAVLLALRDRASLARAENGAISAISVGLLLALPLSMSDFLAASGVSPLRAGGLGLLVFLLAVTRVTAIGGGGPGVLSEVFWACAAAAVAMLAFGFVFGAPQFIDALHVAALMLGLVLTFRTLQLPIEQALTRARSSLWRAFAEAPTGSADAFLDRMLATPELRSARLVEGGGLKGYDAADLIAAFSGSAVLSAEEARTNEQLSVMVDEHEATHVVLMSNAPLRLLFVTMPRVGAGGDVDLQLRLFAKLARQAARA